MPDVTTTLGDDVDHRSAVASVFRTKLVGHDNVLPHKFGIAHEQGRTADAVVVVVLAVNLLVVVASALAVGGEPRAVRVGKCLVARIDYARNEQGQTIQTFVFLQTGKGMQRLTGKCIGDLRLGGL